MTCSCEISRQWKLNILSNLERWQIESVLLNVRINIRLSEYDGIENNTFERLEVFHGII